MRTFWATFFAIVMFSIGYNCIYFYCTLKPLSWYHIPLLIGGWLMAWPAVWWWIDYSKKIFNKED